MGNNITINKPDIANNQIIKPIISLGGASQDLIENQPFFKILTSEGCENFANYIQWLGIARDENPVVLSSLHHYYYDAEEMKNVGTVINLKELNLVKNIKSFFQSIFHILPEETNLLGRFVDNKKNSGYELKNNSSFNQYNRKNDDIENGIVSRFPLLNMLYSFMDSKTNKYLSERSVTLLLEDNGFNVMDMTEISGFTYFHARKKLDIVN